MFIRIEWQDQHMTQAIIIYRICCTHVSEFSEEKPTFDSAERLIPTAGSSHLE